ncbi:MAG: hypothetical protein ATN31_02890 [Candidatus Epulonipiscioides saccharophilum]|nr:MAG: hypothetical protein ATN31_02890 [Epulopiscium sp. AS2M-Bin001]
MIIILTKLKVLHVCSDSNIGGAGRHLLNLYNAKPDDLDLYFLLPLYSRLSPLLLSAGANVIELSIKPDASFVLTDVYKIAVILMATKPDIVHTHANLTARLAAKLTGVKKIFYTRHYALPDSYTPPIKQYFNNFLCDGAIAVTPEAESVLVNMGISHKKIAVIENGVLPIKRAFNSLGIKNSLNIDPESKILLILSRLSPEKCIHHFIEIVNKLKFSKHNILALIVGDGPERDNIINLINQQRLDAKILRFLGFVYEVEDILSITDIILNTSITEAKSLSLLEAMSIGIPAIVSNVGGNPSLIKDGYNGFVVEFGDIDAYVNKIEFLLSNESFYLSMKRHSISRFNQYYHASKMARQIRNFYKQGEL